MVIKSLGSTFSNNLLGNVQAVLCRNGKGFCLTKEHTLKNKKEKRRVLQNGAIISSNEPYGLLEGQINITRGLGFHGNPKLKKFIIPVPHTMTIPIDDLCQFLILATNGLWEVLDKKEVTALAITMFQMYKEIYFFNFRKKSSSKEPLFFPSNKPNAIESKYSKYFTRGPKNVQTFLPEMTNCDTCSEKATDWPTHVDGVPTDSSGREKRCTKGFYEVAAEYVSQGLVNAALMAGSRDNITVMVLLLSGSENQFLK